MKKSLFSFCITCLMYLAALTPNTAHAQAASDHLMTINTVYMMPADSAGRAELRALLKEYFDKVTSKNQYVIHENVVAHYYSDDSRELITITEYASWADIDKANDRSTELEMQAWPDQKQREEYFKKLNKHINYHKDGIYHVIPGTSK